MIKKHERREIGNWKNKQLKSFTLSLYVGGSYEVAEKACREACFPSGLCVTIEKVKYIFGGGSEDGVRVGFINYPPFPEEEDFLIDKAIALGKQICSDGSQFSFSVVTPEDTIYMSRVK